MRPRWWLAPGAAVALTLAAGSALAEDPLPSWTDGPARSRILSFVSGASDPEAGTFVPPEDRIAVFDNDGTLWVEKPTYTQVFFVLERLRQLAPEHPGWQGEEPYRSVLAGKLGGLGVHDLLTLAAATHGGTEQAEFEEAVGRFFATERHPRWSRPFEQLVYQPQLELMEYLRAHDFQVFIVTGGGRDFVRAISEPIYGVPRHMVVGSAVRKRFEMRDGRATLVRTTELVEPLDDRGGKPVHIDLSIGRRPILAVGNSDGDLEMLQYSAGMRSSLQVLVHHDDAQREYAYDEGAEKALEAAAREGWLVVSMKRDFRRVFPFDSPGAD